MPKHVAFIIKTTKIAAMWWAGVTILTLQGERLLEIGLSDLMGFCEHGDEKESFVVGWGHRFDIAWREASEDRTLEPDGIL
jgi:hypothetical protein